MLPWLVQTCEDIFKNLAENVVQVAYFQCKGDCSVAYVAEFEPTDHVGLHLQTDLIINYVYCGPGLLQFLALHFAAPNLVLRFLES